MLLGVLFNFIIFIVSAFIIINLVQRLNCVPAEFQIISQITAICHDVNVF